MVDVVILLYLYGYKSQHAILNSMIHFSICILLLMIKNEIKWDNKVILTYLQSKEINTK